MSRPRAMFAAESAELAHSLFTRGELERLRRCVDLDDAVLEASIEGMPRSAREVEILITGWGAPTFDMVMLAHWPRLRVLVHAAGTVKRLVTDDLWDRGIRVASSAAANAHPVAEYALAMTLLSLKGTLESARAFAATSSARDSIPSGRIGVYRQVVGVIGASRTGRRLIELLRPFELQVRLYDPTLSDRECRELGVEPSTLSDLLQRAAVVTIHAPSLPETRHLIGPDELALMPDGATLINSARGALVDTEALLRELQSGRLRAVLDVAEPQPLPREHPLFTAPGVILTPHIAGSLGTELQRIGQNVVDVITGYLATGELAGEVRRGDLARLA